MFKRQTKNLSCDTPRPDQSGIRKRAHRYRKVNEERLGFESEPYPFLLIRRHQAADIPIRFQNPSEHIGHLFLLAKRGISAFCCLGDIVYSNKIYKYLYEPV